MTAVNMWRPVAGALSATATDNRYLTGGAWVSSPGAPRRRWPASPSCGCAEPAVIPRTGIGAGDRPGQHEHTDPPADLPEQFNDAAGRAILCNDDTSPHDFPTFFKTYRSWQREFPITAGLAPFTQMCAGWPIPAKEPFHLRKSNGSLQLSGHRWESPTPFPWIAQVRAKIGGIAFTVEDDIHGSVARVPECTEHLEAYFLTGRPDSGGCDGVTPPSASAATVAAAAESVPVSTDWAPSGNRWSWRKH